MDAPASRDAHADGAHLCDRCGERMVEHHCRLACPRCGFQRDCSDP